jgi:methylthioribose-1-phosphate isomerase
MIPTLAWTPEGVRFIDQTRLPLEESYVLATTYEQVADVIVTMVVRGAPAIGVSAAYGVALGACAPKPPRRRSSPRVRAHLRPAGWNAAHRGESVLGHRPHEAALRGAAGRGRNPRPDPGKLLAEAHAMYEEDIAACKAMGAFGGALLPRRAAC